MFTNEVIASFNELETSLYNYICENMNKVVYMRIRELAEETHVSTATILRFCRKTGCDGFPEFKARLKLTLQENKKLDLKSTEYGLAEFFDRALSGDLQDKIVKAAKVISEADTVIFTGIGSSGILAEYGSRYFSSLGKSSLFIKDPHFPIHSNHLANSATIALSVSGETTISQINHIKKYGSKIISITNNKHSTLAKISNVNISYYVTEERLDDPEIYFSNITTQVPVVYVLETLAREVYKLQQNNYKKPEEI